MASPFDLHVLSTPPAFILSQDQTLELLFKSIPSKFTWSRISKQAWLFCIRFLNIYCLGPYLPDTLWKIRKNFSSGLRRYFLSEFSGLHYCLFVKVLYCTFTVHKLLYLLFSSATNTSISLPFLNVNSFFDIFFVFFHRFFTVVNLQLFPDGFSILYS